MQSLLQHLRLFFFLVKFTAIQSLEFRLNFFSRWLMDIGYAAVNFTFYFVIFNHISSIGNWGQNEILIFIASYTLVDSLYMVFFADSLWDIPKIVFKGELDYYLIKPVNLLFFCSLRKFSFYSLLNVILALIFLCYALTSYQNSFHFENIILYLLTLINGVFLLYSINLLALLPCFWTQSRSAMQRLCWMFHPFMEKPHSIFEGWASNLLTTFLPFCLIASYPVEILLNPIQWNYILHIFVVSVCFYLTAIFLWKKALKAYASVSS